MVNKLTATDSMSGEADCPLTVFGVEDTENHALPEDVLEKNIIQKEK